MAAISFSVALVTLPYLRKSSKLNQAISPLLTAHFYLMTVWS